jgi:hypothetical protein
MRSKILNPKYLKTQQSLSVILGGLVVTVFAIGPMVCVFKSDRGQHIFKGDKNPEYTFLWRESKAIGPTLQNFMAC